MTGFIVGAILGAAAVWVYGDRLRGYLDNKTRAVRTKAADTLQAAKETIGLGRERPGR